MNDIRRCASSRLTSGAVMCGTLCSRGPCETSKHIHAFRYGRGAGMAGALTCFLDLVDFSGTCLARLG